MNAFEQEGKQQKRSFSQIKECIEIYILSKTRSAKYFNTRLSPAENLKIFNDEKNLIEIVTSGYSVLDMQNICTAEERKQIRDLLMRKAELWYEFRAMGANFSPDKMRILMELEANSYLGGDQRRLEKMGRELGILKGDEDSVLGVRNSVGVYQYVGEKLKKPAARLPLKDWGAAEVRNSAGSTTTGLTRETPVMQEEKQQKRSFSQIKEGVEIYILSKTRRAKYYDIKISPAENSKIFNDEKNLIEIATSGYSVYDMQNICTAEERKQIRDLLMRKAELWYEFRAMGADYPPDKMRILMELEANSYLGGGQSRLEKMGRELGILKRDEDLVLGARNSAGVYQYVGGKLKTPAERLPLKDWGVAEVRNSAGSTTTGLTKEKGVVMEH